MLQSQPDSSSRFLKLSGGALALAITGMILVPFLCCGGGLLFCGFGSFLMATVSPSPTP